jgi:hypothetical protein
MEKTATGTAPISCVDANPNDAVMRGEAVYGMSPEDGCRSDQRQLVLRQLLVHDVILAFANAALGVGPNATESSNKVSASVQVKF